MSLPLPTLMQAQLASVAERLGLPLTAITPQQAGALTFSDFIVDNLQQHPAWWQQLQQQPPQPRRVAALCGLAGSGAAAR